MMLERPMNEVYTPVETAEEALAFLGEWMPAEDLVQLAQLYQEARAHGFAVVKVLVVDRRVDGFRLEKMYE